MSTATQTKMQTPTLSEPHPTLQVYSTLSKRKEPLRTVEAGKVGIYLCGPTVYDKAHIGHMVGPVIFDCIKRYLVYCGYDVTWVVNITDVDDKLIKKANERGISMLDVAEENIADYRFNLNALGVDQIDHFPRATECMDEIIALIESLIEQGFAYESAGDVYFEVGKDREYGKLSNRNVEETQGDGGGTAARKRGLADFALWKTAKPGEPAWDSPWGQGRPGWHIECSAMSRKLLGETFDIHGGGLDLVFPHHENEIAQSECCHGKPMVTYWTHNGLLRASTAAGKVGGRSERAGEPPISKDTAAGGVASEEQVTGKMSRSKGAGGLAQLIERQGGERIRFFLLRTHYRSTVLFNEPAIEEAGTGLDTFYRFFKRYERITGKSIYDCSVPHTREAGEIEVGASELLTEVAAHRKKFITAMDDDFNTGGAIGELFELARALNRYCDTHELEAPSKQAGKLEPFERGCVTLRELAGILGLFGEPASAGGANATDELLSQVMQLVIDLRAEARASKKFATADAIRDGIGPLGITLEDRAGGTEWSGGGADTLDGILKLLIELRQMARASKDFATSDAIRDRLAAIGVTLEDRAGGTEWSKS
jgi:cysteinyl-tRNA synthetase